MRHAIITIAVTLTLISLPLLPPMLCDAFIDVAIRVMLISMPLRRCRCHEGHATPRAATMMPPRVMRRALCADAAMPRVVEAAMICGAP